MVTYYVDYEGGNDASAGTSFATRWQTLTNGATTARIAPGDEIRVMASPDPTSMGSATWTGGGRPLSATITSSTNATPIVVTTTASHGLVTGDYVMITGHTTNTNANGVWRVGTTPTGTTFQILQIDGTNTTGNGVGGATGNFTKVNNTIVKTASALVQNIALLGGLGQKPAWTASANVTTAVETTNFKEGNGSTSIAIAAAFTTGKAAYYTLPSTLNLSGYQQVSFWVRQTAGTIGAAGAVYVALCTDTIGDTVAHTCNVPALGVTGQWFPVTVNLGTNLNSAIRSVAFYVVTDNAAQTFLLDNIIACKAASSADSVTLTSLISKSSGTGDEAWYAAQSINSDAIMLANANTNASNSTSIRGYNGVTETVTTYKRETVKTAPQVAIDSTGVVVINDSGTAGNVIAYSGGWNRTDMSTQTGVTWLDGQNGNGRGLSTSSARSFVTADRINLCRYGNGLILGTSSDISIGSIYTTACSGSGVNHQVNMRAVTITNCWANNNDTGVTMSGIGLVITDVKLASNNSTSGLTFNTGRYNTVGLLVAGNNAVSTANANLRFAACFDCTVGTATLTNSTSTAGIVVTASFSCFVNGGSSSGNTQGVDISSTTSPAELYLNNFTINEATEVVTGTGAGFLYSNRHDNTDNNSWIWQSGIGTINQQTSVVDSPATTAWQMRPTSTNAATTTPLALKLGTVVCAASSLVTVTARMRRDNTGLTMQLVCPGGQISGVATDVSTDMTAAANTWETVTITFTPTKAGGVDIYAYAFGGTTFSGYVSNLTASQA
jgi:hypothetical protein